MNHAFELLHSTLTQEIGLVQEFIVILEAEAATLAQPATTDALVLTTGSKNESADRLAEVAATRHELLVKLGYSADRAGLLAAASDQPLLLDRCNTLFKLASLANELNVANGITIDTFLAHNQQALDTLRSLAGIGNLYDASGRTRAGSQDLKTSIKAG